MLPPNSNPAASSSRLPQRRGLQFPASDAHSGISEAASEMAPKVFCTSEIGDDNVSAISSLTFDKDDDSSSGDDFDMLKQFEQLGRPKAKQNKVSQGKRSNFLFIDDYFLSLFCG